MSASIVLKFGILPPHHLPDYGYGVGCESWGTDSEAIPANVFYRQKSQAVRVCGGGTVHNVCRYRIRLKFFPLPEAHFQRSVLEPSLAKEKLVGHGAVDGGVVLLAFGYGRYQHCHQQTGEQKINQNPMSVHFFLPK
jgi:hypothetical protein